MSNCPNVLPHIAGHWREGEGGRGIEVLNPANEEVIGTVAHAAKNDLDAALAAAGRGFAEWRRVSAFERSRIMRKAANLLRERAEGVARVMASWQGTTMGPMADERRVPQLEAMIAGARGKGAEVATGGNRIGNKGYFFEPTVLTGAAPGMRAMNEEPFDGVKDSGYGTEGGSEAIGACLNAKFVSQAGL